MTCLNKHLLDARLSLVEQIVDFLHISHVEAMGDHVQGLDFVGLNEFEEMIPVFVDGRLAITDQADAGLHEGADIEMVALSSISIALYTGR